MEKERKISKKLTDLFNAGFFWTFIVLFALVAVIGYFLVSVFGETGEGTPAPFLSVFLQHTSILLCFAALTAAFVLCAHRLRSGQLNSRFKLTFTATVIAAVVLMLAVQLTCAYLLRMNPITDVSRIDTYAQKIVTENSFDCVRDGYNDFYIVRYRNNLPYLLIVTLFYKVTYPVTGSFSRAPIIVFNVLCINLAVLLTVLLSRRIFGERKALLTLLLCLLFAPYYTFTPYFYTDSFSIPFTVGTVYAFVAAIQSSGKKKLLLLLLCGALCCIGFKIKGSLIILIPAFIIYLLLQYGFKRCLKMTAAFLLSFVILLASYTGFVKASNIIPEDVSQRWQYPYTHWLMIGLNDYGAYTLEDNHYTYEYEGIEAKKQANLEEIQRRFAQKGFWGTVLHVGIKAVWTHMDGTYYIANYLEDYQERCALHSLLLYEGRFHPAFYAYSCGFQLFLLFIMAYSAKRAWKQHKCDITTLFRIAVFGMFLFFLIWETNARYPYNFTPLYLLIATDGTVKLAERFAEHRRTKAK